jgi:transcriptional regulator with XRE-family HTH domain
MLGQPQTEIITIPGRKRDRVRLLRQYRGVQVEVARELGVSRSHVCKVISRNSKSDRVWKAFVMALAKRRYDELKSELAHAS